MSSPTSITPTFQLPTGFAPLRVLAKPAIWVAVLVEWDRRHRDRHHLGTLSPGHLEDMGMTAADVAAECAKPFWRA